VKKGTAKKTSRGGELTRRDRLRAEISAALEDIDEEGLVFILEQANVLLHNARVEELERKRRARGDEGAAADAPQAPKAPAAGVEESADRKTYFLVLGKERKVLSRAEMQQVAKICHDAPTTADAATRLHAVFSRERRDILMDAGIGSASSPLLVALADAVRARVRPSEA
jgi:hypothetical protein